MSFTIPTEITTLDALKAYESTVSGIYSASTNTILTSATPAPFTFVTYSDNLVKEIVYRTLIPEIVNVKILGEEKNVVEVTFEDGRKEKAVCNPADISDLEVGIGVCIGKYLLGGSSDYNRVIKQGLKIFNQIEEKRIKEELKATELEERRKRKYLKNQKRKERKAERERQARIQEQAEAMVLAQKMMEENK